MTALRVSLALVVTAVGVTALHHHKHLGTVHSEVVRQPSPPVEVPDLAPRRAIAHRTSRSHIRPALHNYGEQDVTEYCATGNRNAAGRWPQLGDVAVIDRDIPFGTEVSIAGNVYVVRDWVGYGTQWDIFAGNDAGCEQRALNYGRQHLRVVEVAP